MRVDEGYWFLIRMQSMIHHELGGGLYDEPRRPSTDFVNACYGLLLVQAYSLLESALRQLRDEGLFACKTGKLGDLMRESRAHLPWANYDVVENGQACRNKLVHEMEAVDPLHVLTYVQAVQAELAAWSSLGSKPPSEQSLSP